MSMLPPFLPQTIRYASSLFPDVEPFSIRSGASYEEIQYSIVVWIRDQLTPYLTENDPAGVWATNAAALTDAVNAALAAQTASFTTAFGAQFTGSMSAPAPTGNPAVDTPALQNAITAAQTAGFDLRITPSPLGTVKNYAVNVPLSWSLARGSLLGTGQVGIDFSAVPTTYTGAALKVFGQDGNFTDGAHLAAMHRLDGFRLLGHNTDTSTMDGLLFTDTLGGVDQGSVRSVLVYGFRDGLTFGDNVWSTDFQKCAFANSHRYGVNLTMGTNAGEQISFTGSSVYGTTNAAKNAVAIYSPPAGRADFRMFGGSLDYNDQQGSIEGGSLSFHAVHVEDDRTGPMFTYAQSVAKTSVSFRDCNWDSSATATRPFIHQILSNTTGTGLTLSFDGDKGGVYPNTFSTWLQDDSGATDFNILAAIRGFSVDGTILLGQLCSIVPNGKFDTNAFVAGPGTLGWFPGVTSGATWTIGSGGNPGSGIRLVATTSGNHYAQQMVAIPAGRPLSIGGKIFVNAVTAGGAELLVDFYAADGTTLVAAGGRVGSSQTAQSSTWYYTRRRFMPPKGTAFARVKLSGGGFTGTATWDEIEVVPL